MSNPWGFDTSGVAEFASFLDRRQEQRQLVSQQESLDSRVVAILANVESRKPTNAYHIYPNIGYIFLEDLGGAGNLTYGQGPATLDEDTMWVIRLAAAQQDAIDHIAQYKALIDAVTIHERIFMALDEVPTAIITGAHGGHNSPQNRARLTRKGGGSYVQRFADALVWSDGSPEHVRIMQSDLGLAGPMLLSPMKLTRHARSLLLRCAVHAHARHFLRFPAQPIPHFIAQWTRPWDLDGEYDDSDDDVFMA